MSQPGTPVTEADYIVIGAGSAGAVIANRLSAKPHLRVLLIEAGPAGMGLRTSVPAGSVLLLGNRKADWGFVGEPDASLNGRRITWPAGRMLGGSSALNGMVYMRGFRADFDGWAADGCPGWSFDEILPYFLRSENFHGPASQFHGANGPMAVSPARTLQQLAEPFRQACHQTGLPLLDEYCGGDMDGAFLPFGTTDAGRRASTATAFLDPVRGRHNLTILTDCETQQILFEGTRAVGVRTSRAGIVTEYRACKEVVVCAGAIGSPALLLRSGLGPAADLAALGIGPVADIPGVGRNFHDHVSIMLSKQVRAATYNTGMDPIHLLGHILNYALFKRGRLASITVQSVGYGRSRPELATPDFALNFLPLAIEFAGGKPQLRKQNGISIAAHPAQPHGRGQIKLRDANPATPPLIAHQLLADDRDIETLLSACALAGRIFEAPALAAFMIGDYDPMPRSRDEWIAYLRQRASIGFHPVGSCRMGNGPMAVTAPDLKVRRVQNLRIADASIMPRITSGNTNAPTIMIAEKAAEMILAGHSS